MPQEQFVILQLIMTEIPFQFVISVMIISF